ncbi:MAG: hypothetical protein AB7S65_04745 [Sulfuricurvum sp.]
MVLYSIPVLFRSASADEILTTLTAALERSDEAPFWKQKAMPLLEAVLSVLIPLREQNLLFDPEERPAETLTPKLFLRWCDLLSLKTLAFTLSKSNEAHRLQRTRYDDIKASAYTEIDLEILGKYLSGYSVNLSDEWVDFPVSNYNLHIGLTTLFEKIFKGTPL